MDGMNTPCLKHAVSNLEEKSKDISSDVSLCSNCSKTMLSYIFLIQDVLDNLAKSIYGRRDSQCCVQCLRQEMQAEPPKREKSVDGSEMTSNDVFKEEVVNHSVIKETSNKEETVSTNGAAIKAKKPSSRRNSRRLSREIKNIDKTPLKTTDISYVNQDWKINFLYNVSSDRTSVLPTVKSDRFMKIITLQDKFNKIDDESSKEKSYMNEEVKDEVVLNPNSTELLNEVVSLIENEAASSIESIETLSTLLDENCEDNKTTMNHQYSNKKYVEENGTEPFLETYNFNEDNVLLPSAEEDSRYDSPQEPEETLVHLFWNKPLPEAFVTICRNNSEAIGCLVLGSSILLSRSSKVLCVLVFEEVHEELRELLASIFQVVQSVSSLDPIKNGSKSRNYLNPLEILNVWRLIQFSKCVFLNSDTLVLRNCDELFNFSELSAVPDNGWPDCFNCGVFVFVPSVTTFYKMNALYDKQGYTEGGDQIFLNMYFNTWAEDLSKKLPFIYNLNLIGASTYTYAAAFQRFGQNVKIVQFSGSLKPWHIEFCNESNQIMDSSCIPKTSMRFVNEWMNIFRVTVTRLLPMEVYSLTFSQKSISARDIMSILCEPERTDHVRNRTCLNDWQENASINNNFTKISSSSKNFSVIQHNIKPIEMQINKKFTNLQYAGNISNEKNKVSIGIEDLHNFSPPKDNLVPISSFIHSVPVTCDNYDGMRMWEQGKMDYEGIDNSEGIIKRLQLLIQ